MSATTISGVIAPDPSDTSPELQPPKVTAKPPGEEHFTAHGVESGIAMIENLIRFGYSSARLTRVAVLTAATSASIGAAIRGLP